MNVSCEIPVDLDMQHVCCCGWGKQVVRGIIPSGMTWFPLYSLECSRFVPLSLSLLLFPLSMRSELDVWKMFSYHAQTNTRTCTCTRTHAHAHVRAHILMTVTNMNIAHVPRSIIRSRPHSRPHLHSKVDRSLSPEFGEAAGSWRAMQSK